MMLKYQGAYSSTRNFPGGFGAGTWLGGLLFIVKFNEACLRPPIPRPITRNHGQQFKFVDDASQIVSVNLRKSLIPDPVKRPRPLNYHKRTEMILSEQENVLQQELNKFALFTQLNKLVINQGKCYIIKFSRSRTYDFPPEFSIQDSDTLQVKNSHKILGIIVQDDLKWEEQVQEMVRKATKTIWVIRRMKSLGIGEATLVQYWKTEGRVQLEQSCPVWHSSITIAQSNSLSRAQRVAMAAITGHWADSHSEQLKALSLEPLKDRREAICRTFAHRTATNSRHQDMFTPTHTVLRQGKQTLKYREPRARTNMYYNLLYPT